MGEEDQRESKLKAFKGFQVNTKLLSYASNNVKFMHCLPRHEEEVSDEVRVRVSLGL